ncbi:hypothetical protein [Variovorax sp. UC74_104]
MGRNKNKEISAALFKKIAPLLPVVVSSANARDHAMTLPHRTSR